MKKFKILIIDDIQENIFSLITILEQNPHFELKGISSAIKALSYIDQQVVDLILCDVQMPNMDGFEFVSIIRLRKKTANIPVIFVSAHKKESAFFQKSKELGAIDYLVKPIDADELVHRLNTYHKFAMREHEKIKELNELNSKLSQNNSFLQSLEEKVTERTRELNTILTLSPDGFVLVSADNHIHYINPAFLNMTGLQLDKLIGKPAEIFIESMASLFDPSKMVDVKCIGEEDGEQMVYLSRPTALILHCNIRTMYGPEGEKDGQVLYFRDVTHEIEIDRMKSDFLSTAAHELRTPLASIYGFSELLMAREYDKETSHKIFDTIHRQSLHLKRLLDELLDLSRIEARAGKDFHMQENTLQGVVQELCTDVKGAFSGRKVDLQTQGDWPLLSFDVDKMRQVLSNLLSNGFKYSPENENVILQTSEREKNGDRQFGVSVIDKGIGMTAEQLGRVGERFYRADDSGSVPGSGLGVSLVNEIISIHGGNVEFVSTTTKGTTATVWLPIIKNEIKR
jgi:PAS domain S-box-containing protein